MKKFFALFLSLMMLFAVSAVAETIDMSAPTFEVGEDSAEYEVEGQVYDEDYKPLEKMQVVVRTFDDYSHEWPDTVYTDAAGYYHVNYGIPSFGGDCMEVIVHDPNGEYESDSVHIS